MPRVPECHKWPEYLLSLRECPSTSEFLQSAQIRQNLGSLFVRINKSVRTAALTKWSSCQNSVSEKCPDTELFLVCIFLFRTRNHFVFGHFSRSDCLIKIAYDWLTLIYLNSKKQYWCNEIDRFYFRKQRKLIYIFQSTHWKWTF